MKLKFREGFVSSFTVDCFSCKNSRFKETAGILKIKCTEVLNSAWLTYSVVEKYNLKCALFNNRCIWKKL